MKSIFIILFIFSNQLYAFDGRRSGFQLAVGFGNQNLTAEYNDESESKSKRADFYAFKIGYGLFSDLIFHIGKRSSIYEMADETIYNEIGGVELNYYFGDFYFIWAKGASAFLNKISFNSNNMLIGSGGYYGIGYEFYEHIALEIVKVDSSVTLDSDEEIVAPEEQSGVGFLLVLNAY